MFLIPDHIRIQFQEDVTRQPIKILGLYLGYSWRPNSLHTGCGSHEKIFGHNSVISRKFQRSKHSQT